MNTLDAEKLIRLGIEVINTEQEAIAHLIPRIGDDFVKACNYMLNCDGKIVVIGMGKSGHIASKIAATLSSTGSPAFFVHPGEASHGDVGMISVKDVVLAISNSGNTAEILAILPVIKRLNVPLVTLTGNTKSTLAKEADVNLDVSVEKEACPLGLAPTSSTTATLVMGDALAIALLEIRGFTRDDFALSHPGGALGKRLLLKIGSLMRCDNAIPKVKKSAYLKTALIEVSAKQMGMTTVVDENDKLIGIFTDGDLRRTFDKGLDVHTTKIAEVMTYNCKTISADTLAYESLKIMEQHGITTLVVVNSNNEVVGVLHMHDILKAGIM